MSDKNRKAGLLVGGIFISIALVFLLISIGFKHIGVKKKDALSTQESVSSYTDTANTSNTTPQAEEDVWGTEGGNDNTNTPSESPATDNTATTDEESVPEVDANESQGTGADNNAEEESQGTVTTDTVKSDDTSSNKTVATTEDASQVGAWTEINESSIDYSVDELQTEGVVSAKKVYLTAESTLVYCIDIDCKVDGEKRVLSYYCGYSAYDNVKEGDLVSVKYKNPTGSTIMVTKVEVN